MALAVAEVRGTNFGSASTAHALDISLGNTVAADELLICSLGWPTSTSSVSATDSTGDAWTRLESYAINGAANLAVFAKIADGDEDSASVGVTTGQSEDASGAVYRITGFEGTIADDIQLSAKTTGTADANPAAVNAAATGNTNLFIVFSLLNNNEPVVGNPSNYTEGYEVVDTGVDHVFWTGYRILEADTDDPGTIDYDDADSGDTWATSTLVVEGVAGGAATQDITGALFQRTPTFFTGTIAAGAVNLAGVLFQKAPTFFTGTVTPGAVDLAGTLFQKAPTFFTGTVGQALEGELFQSTPTFFQGAVTVGAVDVAGVLFQNTPTFPQGAVDSTYPLTGVLFQSTPTFLAGTVEVGAAVLTGTLFQSTPVFFQGAVVPETLELAGILFRSTAVFNNGTVASTYPITGVLAVFDPTFPAGFIANRIDHDTDNVLLDVTADPFGKLDLEEV